MALSAFKNPTCQIIFHGVNIHDLKIYDLITVDGLVKTIFCQFSVIPAYAGMTERETFNEIITVHILTSLLFWRLFCLHR